MSEKVRLGGMALANGVLVHGPRHWACAVRTDDGRLVVASDRKPLRAADIANPLVRAPARIAEVFALFPVVHRRLPEARLPFARLEVLGAMAATAVLSRALRRTGLGALTVEAAGSLLALAPAVLAVRGTPLAAYHGAEHVAIGSYEHDEPRTREHERCGTHLVGPLLVASALGGALASKAPAEARPFARIGATVAALGVSVEVFGWMVRHPESRAARALAWPGHVLQERFVTAEPSPEQLEVAGAALAECLRLEQGEGGTGAGPSGR